MGEALVTFWVEKSSTGQGFAYIHTSVQYAMCHCVQGPRGRIAATEGGLGPGAGVLLYILRD